MKATCEKITVDEQIADIAASIIKEMDYNVYYNIIKVREDNDVWLEVFRGKERKRYTDDY